MAWTTPKTWAFQEGVESSELNTHLRDNLNALGPDLVVHKTVDESIVSNDVLQDDDHLFFSIGANEAWFVRFVLLATGSDIKVALNSPTGSTGWWIMEQTATGAITQAWQTPATFVDGETKLQADGPANPMASRIECYVLNSSTAGTFRLRWAQAAVNATPTVLKKGSFLNYRKLA